jgi:hypothetical protein
MVTVPLLKFLTVQIPKFDSELLIAARLIVFKTAQLTSWPVRLKSEVHRD